MRILQLKRGLIIEGNDYDGMCFGTSYACDDEV